MRHQTWIFFRRLGDFFPEKILLKRKKMMNEKEIKRPSSYLSFIWRDTNYYFFYRRHFLFIEMKRVNFNIVNGKYKFCLFSEIIWILFKFSKKNPSRKHFREYTELKNIWKNCIKELLIFHRRISFIPCAARLDEPNST